MHDRDKVEIYLKDKKIVALVGNPNVGKSVIFGLLTGRYVTVANYPGTTVEITEGLSNFDKDIVVIDTPGMNSLTPHSEDEKVARDILIDGSPKVIVHISDSKNLRRSLLLTTKLLELKLPLVLCLNMSDEARTLGIKIDTRRLSELLDLEVVETVAIEKQGIERLIHSIKNARISNFKIELRPGARRNKIDEIVKEVCQDANLKKGGNFLESLGRLMTNPVWGFPFLFLVLYGIYKFVGEFAAQTCVNFLENVIFGEFFVPWLDAMLRRFIPSEFIREIIVGKYGIISMGLTYSLAIILPIVSAFFICFGLLEDSGYLPRLSIMVNRIFKKIGLTGKAVLPMVLGLGCDTMATLTTRILDTKKERIIATLLLALGIPCSAQLGVIMAMLSAVSIKAFVLVFGVVVLQMLLVGYLASKIIKGAPSDFILEIPPVRVPLLSNVFVKTYIRVKWFLKEAVPLFLLGTLILFVADKLGLLLLIERFARPVVVGFLSLPAEAAISFIIGFLRRDYGAAGLYNLAREGMLSPIQVVVSMVVITLFVPCLANFFVIIKERGVKTALWIVGFIFPFAILVGGALNFVLRYFKMKI